MYIVATAVKPFCESYKGRNPDHPADLGVCHARLLIESLAAVLITPKLAI